MTTQIKPISAETEYDFPSTGAKTRGIRSNGFVINYIDLALQPESTFIYGESWDACRDEFERGFDHEVIINHLPGYLSYDF